MVVTKIYNHLIGNQTKVCQGEGGNSYKVELYIAKRYKNQIKSSFGRKRRYQKFFLKCVNTKQTLIHSYIIIFDKNLCKCWFVDNSARGSFSP